MGQAHRAPTSTYQRKRFVSDKAVVRLREWVADKGHLPDEDLRNEIDRAVESAAGAGRTTPYQYHDAEQTLVDLQEDLGTHLYAIVAANAREDSPWSEAVITLATPSQIAGRGERIKVGGGAMAAALGGVARDGLPEQLPAGAPLPAKVVKGAPKEEWVIFDRTFSTYTAVLAADVSSYVADLVSQGRNAADIKVFRPVKLRTRVIVDLDIEES